MANSKKKVISWHLLMRWIILACLFICGLLYLKIDGMDNDSNRDHLVEGYFVNTSGCHMLAMNPFSKTALRHLQHFEELKCTELQLLSAETRAGQNYLELMMSVDEIEEAFSVNDISDIQCVVKMVKRATETWNNYTEKGSFRLRTDDQKQIHIPSGPAIVNVLCYEGSSTVYRDVHFFIPPPPVPHQIRHRRESLSVMIIGIDSVSHMHFKRTMPLLNAYIKRLPHVEFWGYNRVGRNSFPNLVPMLSGLNDSELNDLCYTGRRNFDSCPLIWKDFKAAGYRTVLAEDSIFGTFNYGVHGFHRQPTDFYMRPLMVEINRHTRYSIDENEVIHCTAGRKYAEVLYEFMYKMMPHLKANKHFSMFWQSQGVHDYFNYAQFLDEPYVKLFDRLKNTGIMDNTIIFLMSDHGLRMSHFRSTYQGMIEESQPLLTAIYPYWMEQEYPLAMENFEKNAHSLITTFDLHATLKDLTHENRLCNENVANRRQIQKKQGRNIPRGLSLFLPIPEERDCDMAGIPSAFCLCHTFKQIDSDDDRVQKVAYFIVHSINQLIIDYAQCQRLRLGAILDAYKLDRSKNQFDYKVQLRTIPGHGLFEGTITATDHSLALNGPILRINRYGNQSYCIRNVHIEMYCYCQL